MTPTHAMVRAGLIYQIANYLYDQDIRGTITHAQAIMGMVEAALAARPAAESTMTTTPTGPMVTSEMVLAAVRIARERGHDTPSHLVNPMLKAALAAMPAAEPDGLAGEVEYLRKMVVALDTISDRHCQRLDAHDAALAERVKKLERRLGQIESHQPIAERGQSAAKLFQWCASLSSRTLGMVKRLDAHDGALADLRERVETVNDDANIRITSLVKDTYLICERLEDLEATPLEPDDDIRDALVLHGAALAEVRSEMGWMLNEIRVHDATLQGPFYEIAPAPSPLVVTDELWESCIRQYELKRGGSEPAHAYAIRQVLYMAATYWNASRDAAGDDQGDTPAENSEP